MQKTHANNVCFNILSLVNKQHVIIANKVIAEMNKSSDLKNVDQVLPLSILYIRYGDFPFIFVMTAHQM